MARSSTRDAVVVNMGSNGTIGRDKKQLETLFGPNIGVVNSAPSWAQPISKQTADRLSPEIIQTWIKKSKEPSQPTTTLQALVNLKRPTLRLVPLTAVPDDDTGNPDSRHHHGLEFEYDCDAPKCRITVNVILPADHPLAENVDDTGFSRIPIYESVVDGGFGKILKLEEGATLELDQFEQTDRADALAPEKAHTTEGAESGLGDNDHNDRSRKRFSAFHFRKRPMSRSVSGPALTVVDADRTQLAEHEREREAREDMKEGVRAAICLSALDEDGNDATTTNEQVTYLHVVRLGAPPPEREDDVRPWVVRVVKREAVIGPYRFQLHEIYGLSSNSPAYTQPRASPTSTDAHTYPPSGIVPPVREEEPSSECLVCLSSPREVLLLPCRHLVACRGCAINMVEFGAGGTIAQPDDTANNNPSATAEGGGGAAARTTFGGEGTTAPSVVPPNPRRKRRPKGWNCPVCRQPYTSLLRISTTPPTKDISDDELHTSIDHEDGEGSDLEPEQEHRDEHTSSDHPSTEDSTPSTGSGVLNSLRSSLRRNIHGGDNETLPPDVEREAGVVAT
ncbi:hypothetical protein V8B97DRAFT_1979546 [Scleroderma yunnanense]